jgi:hypothetical protein
MTGYDQADRDRITAVMLKYEDEGTPQSLAETHILVAALLSIDSKLEALLEAVEHKDMAELLRDK